MPVGRSGRIVVDLDPELKRTLHARLRSDGQDFKSWLLERVQDYLGAPRETEGAPRDREAPPSGLGEIESELSEIEKRVLDALSADGPAQHHVDDLLHATGLGVGEIHAALLQLELQGLIVQQLGQYRRARPA
jgi:predicted Rossmann fold nucleotide-binding protein DprA/Smf involved in DNA uptake